MTPLINVSLAQIKYFTFLKLHSSDEQMSKIKDKTHIQILNVCPTLKFQNFEKARPFYNAVLTLKTFVLSSILVMSRWARLWSKNTARF